MAIPRIPELLAIRLLQRMVRVAMARAVTARAALAKMAMTRSGMQGTNKHLLFGIIQGAVASQLAAFVVPCHVRPIRGDKRPSSSTVKLLTTILKPSNGQTVCGCCDDVWSWNCRSLGHKRAVRGTPLTEKNLKIRIMEVLNAAMLTYESVELRIHEDLPPEFELEFRR